MKNWACQTNFTRNSIWHLLWTPPWKKSKNSLPHQNLQHLNWRHNLLWRKKNLSLKRSLQKSGKDRVNEGSRGLLSGVNAVSQANADDQGLETTSEEILGKDASTVPSEENRLQGREIGGMRVGTAAETAETVITIDINLHIGTSGTGIGEETTIAARSDE